MKKANQKRLLGTVEIFPCQPALFYIELQSCHVTTPLSHTVPSGAVAIEDGHFTTAFFKKDNLSELFGTSVVVPEAGVKASPKHRTIAKGDLEKVGSNTPLALPLPTHWLLSITTLAELTNPYSPTPVTPLTTPQALAAAEDVEDVTAASRAKGEIIEELTDFDEEQPIKGEKPLVSCDYDIF